jgi:phosphate starvation-inducible PhoH-like protein
MLKDVNEGQPGKVKVDLSEKISFCDISFDPVDNRRLMSLCGRTDEHLRQIEQRLNVQINNRGSHFQILGEKDAIHTAHELINKLYRQTEKGHELTPEIVHRAIQENAQDIKGEATEESGISALFIKTPKMNVKSHSKNQRLYVENIFKHDINFGIGPAGSGKTFLAVACAVAALEAEKVRRIVLVRPAVEAGESLGFLPGDLSQKIDPYLRHLYDALYEMLGFESVNKLIERHVIELAPLAYMRGRTLNDAFIILDEGQNTTSEQMKMFLTRIGFGSVAVITGDITQIDLPRGVTSGLKQIITILNGVPGISFNFFEVVDIVRHPLVQRIVEAYDKFEKHD